MNRENFFLLFLRCVFIYYNINSVIFHTIFNPFKTTDGCMLIIEINTQNRPGV